VREMKDRIKNSQPRCFDLDGITKIKVVLITTILIISASVAGGTVGTDRQKQGQDFGETVGQEITVIPDNSDTNFIAGGTYTIGVKSEVLGSDFLENLNPFGESGVENPRIDTRLLSPSNAEIVNNPQEQDPDTTVKVENSQYVHLTTKGDQKFVAGDEYMFFLRIRIPTNTDSSFLRVEIEVHGNGDTEEKVIRYPITSLRDTDENTPEALADAAQAKANLVENYRIMYDQIFNQYSLNENMGTRLAEAYSIYSAEIMKSSLTQMVGVVSSSVETASKVKEANDQFQGGSAEAEVGGLAVAQAQQLQSQIRLDNIQRTSGVTDVTKALKRLEELYRQEADYWESGNREQLREVLNKERRVLCVEKSHTDSDLCLHSPDYTGGGTQDLAAKVSEAESPSLHSFLFSLNKFVVEEDRRIENNRKSLARKPAPNVRTGSSESEIEKRLNSLSVGEEISVTFRVTNGQSGGPTEEGYLSVSHSTNLDLVKKKKFQLANLERLVYLQDGV
jgi:hypothetical protein